MTSGVLLLQLASQPLHTPSTQALLLASAESPVARGRGLSEGVAGVSTLPPAGRATGEPGPGPVSDAEAGLTNTIGLLGLAATTICLVIATLIILIGNTLVVLSVFTHRPLRQVQNLLIVSLAASDLAVGLVVLPLSLAKHLSGGRWVLGQVLCMIYCTSDVFFCTASILNLCVIALDRYCAIRYPIGYARKRTVKNLLSVIAIVYLLSIVISVPPLFGWYPSGNSSSVFGLKHVRKRHKAAEPSLSLGLGLGLELEAAGNEDEEGMGMKCELSDEPGYVIYSALGSFYIPAAVIIIVYINVFRVAQSRLRKQRHKAQAIGPGPGAGHTGGRGHGRGHGAEGRPGHMVMSSSAPGSRVLVTPLASCEFANPTGSCHETEATGKTDAEGHGNRTDELKLYGRGDASLAWPWLARSRVGLPSCLGRPAETLTADATDCSSLPSQLYQLRRAEPCQPCELGQPDDSAGLVEAGSTDGQRVGHTNESRPADEDRLAEQPTRMDTTSRETLTLPLDCCFLARASRPGRTSSCRSRGGHDVCQAVSADQTPLQSAILSTDKTHANHTKSRHYLHLHLHHHHHHQGHQQEKQHQERKMLQQNAHSHHRQPKPRDDNPPPTSTPTSTLPPPPPPHPPPPTPPSPSPSPSPLPPPPPPQHRASPKCLHPSCQFSPCPSATRSQSAGQTVPADRPRGASRPALGTSEAYSTDSLSWLEARSRRGKASQTSSHAALSCPTSSPTYSSPESPSSSLSTRAFTTSEESSDDKISFFSNNTDSEMRRSCADHPRHYQPHQSHQSVWARPSKWMQLVRGRRWCRPSPASARHAQGSRLWPASPPLQASGGGQCLETPAIRPSSRMADTAKWAEFQFTSAAAATIASRPVGCEPGQQNERFADPPCLEARPISPQDGPSRETLKVAMASTKPSDPDRCNGMHPVARLKSMRKCATATAAAAGTKADVSTISASTSTPRVSSANERPEGVGAAMMTAKPTGETGLRPVDCGSARMPQSCSSLNATAMGSASTTGVYLQSFAQERHKISLTRERRAARTLAIIMGTFILCWLPFFLMYVILPLCGRPCRERMDNRAESFIVWLGYLNSAINPILYTTFNVDFRHAFQKLLPFNRCSLCCQRPG